MRRLVGKSDTLDAENAARAVLAGFATAGPKTADGTVEMIRQLKVAHDTAVKDRSSALTTLKAMLIHGSDQLRQDTAPKSQIMLARHRASLRPSWLETPDDSIRHTLRSLARRWLALDAETSELQTMIEGFVLRTAPQLVESFGIGIDTAGKDPHRRRRQPRTDPLRSSTSETRRHQPHPGVLRDDLRLPPHQPGRPPATEPSDLSHRRRPHALPPAHDRLRDPPHHRRSQ